MTETSAPTILFGQRKHPKYMEMPISLFMIEILTLNPRKVCKSIFLYQIDSFLCVCEQRVSKKQGLIDKLAYMCSNEILHIQACQMDPQSSINAIREKKLQQKMEQIVDFLLYNSHINVTYELTKIIRSYPPLKPQCLQFHQRCPVAFCALEFSNLYLANGRQVNLNQEQTYFKLQNNNSRKTIQFCPSVVNLSLLVSFLIKKQKEFPAC